MMHHSGVTMDTAVLLTPEAAEELQSPQHHEDQEDVWSECDSGESTSIDHQISSQSEQNGRGGRVGLLIAGSVLIGAAIGYGAEPIHKEYISSRVGSHDPSLPRPGSRRPQSFEAIDEPETIYDPLGFASTDGGDSSSDGIDTSREVEPVPPMSELVHDDEIKGEVDWMMDFAIIGNPKCGTTFLMHWLNRNDDTFMHNGELCALSQDRPHDIVNMYYDQVVESGRFARTSDGHKIKAGLKCPKEINTERGLDNWQKYFPETKFIVTTRHPVLWFQSFYNYDAYGYYPKDLPHPNELIGACFEDKAPYLCTEHCGHQRPGNCKICTDRSNFHHSLSRLGKTPMSTNKEKKMLDHDMSIVPAKGKVFLMEISQLFPDNPASEHLREDIQDFLDLKYELRSLNPRKTGASSWQYHDKEKRSAFINICDDEYAPVREVLVQNGKEAAQWIRDYFMKSEDVVVSSPELFLELIDKWGEDPCDSAPGRRLNDDYDDFDI